MKVELNSNDIRRLIGTHLQDGTCSDFTLVVGGCGLVAVGNEDLVNGHYEVALPLGDITCHEDMYEAEEWRAIAWQQDTWKWAEIVHRIEDNLELHGHWVQWIDPEHYLYGGTALARLPAKD